MNHAAIARDRIPCGVRDAVRGVAESLSALAAVALSSEPGTYALVLHARIGAEIAVGRLGALMFDAGYYAYVGSAFGPGGVRARVGRHLRREKPRRWHVDYLSACCCPVAVWYTHDRERREHVWARTMLHRGAGSPVAGFGSSDCECHSHLFHTVAVPKLSRFRRAIAREVVGHAAIHALPSLELTPPALI